MSKRTTFEDDLERGLQQAARASLLARRLKRPADRTDCLRAAADLAAGIGNLGALQAETAERLKTIRSHKRSQHAYSGAATLSGRR